jgi:RNA methyltransferase, TrmH family
MLRCAAAFGYSQVLALQGTAALWAPKVLRAAMGAHFGLQLHEGVNLQSIQGLQQPLLATSSHQGDWLHQAALPWPHAWLMGNEGEGLSAQLQAFATRHIRIAQPGGEESLNVATAAAICMHAGATMRLTP